MLVNFWQSLQTYSEKDGMFTWLSTKKVGTTEFFKNFTQRHLTFGSILGKNMFG